MDTVARAEGPAAPLAEAGALLGALRGLASLPGPRDAAVVLDDGPASGVWWPTARRFAELVRRSGAFDRVALRGPGGGRPLPARPGRVTLLLTDGWAQGRAAGGGDPQPARWAATGPVAVVQLLPRPLWDRTRLTTWPALLRPAGGAAGRLRCRVRGIRPQAGSPVPIPVLALDPDELGLWVRLLTGRERNWAALPVTFAARAPVPAAPRPPSPLPRPPADLVDAFRRWAPPEVFELGVLLAAVPLTGPLLRRVGRLAPPGAEPSGTALLLAHQLVRPVAGPHRTGAQRARFDFVPGVREELLAFLRREELTRLVRTVTEELGPGSRRLWVLPGLMADPKAPFDVRADAETLPWLTAQQAVLGALSGPHLEAARRIGQAVAARTPPPVRYPQPVPRHAPAALHTPALLPRTPSGVLLVPAPPGEAGTPGRLVRADGEPGRARPPAGARTPGPAAPGDPAPRDTGGAHGADAPGDLRGTSGTPRARDAQESQDDRDTQDTQDAQDAQDAQDTRDIRGAQAMQERGQEMVEASRPRSGTRSGRTPVVWGNVPPQNANFIGREDLLENLHRRLQRERATAVLPNALHGMGGVGKSALVVEYLYRRLGEYDVIWWVPAERTTQIQRSLAELALRLGLKTSGEAGTAVPAVLEALRRGDPYEDWLLVFDNAESPEAVRGYFPAGGTGNILVTSRNPQWSHVARPLEVDVFARTESAQLLRRRGPDLTGDEADRLADALGDLPLAVEQAAAWLAETGMTADEYLRLFEEKRLELLDDSESPDYNMPVIAAWNVSLDQLEAKNPAALQLLQVCSFCAPEPIPRRLFNRLRDRSIAPELDVALRDPIRQAQAIREIGRYSLARMDHRTNAVQMHRLVQMALQARMTDEEQERMRHGAHQLLVANDPEDPENPGEWDRYGELTPHVMASDALHSEDGWVRSLVVNEVKYLWRWGDYETGGDMASKAYAIWRERFGADDPLTLQVAKWVSVLNFSRGRYQDAADLNTEVLEAYRRTVGEDHQDTLDALGNVAIDYRVRGEFDTALELSESVHERYLRLNGEEDPETLRAAHNVGVSLRLAGLFERARQLDDDTWNHKIRMFGADHAASLVTWLGLIVDIRELGDYRQAMSFQEDITSQCRRVLSVDNPLTMSCLRHLAVTRRKAGRHEEARKAAESSRRRLVERYGAHDPESLAAALEVTVNLRHSGELEEALELGQRTWEQYRDTFGPAHPHTLAAHVNLAVTVRLAGDPEGARAIDEDAFALLREKLGDGHPLTLVCATNLASDLFAAGEPGQARELDTETLRRSTEVFDADHPSTLACAGNLAMDLRAAGRATEANALHAETAERLRTTLGGDHPAVGQALDWEHRANCDIDPMPL